MQRITPLVNDQYYHIFNRGTEKRKIFTQSRDYNRFLQTFFYYQFTNLKKSFSKLTKSELELFKPFGDEKQVEIICYVLMPNHFHFIIKQLKEGGISSFISKFCNSYSKYFNTKYSRVGPLFQARFKAVLIDTDEQLIHVSRYIHLNPIVSGLTKNLADYRWSSYHEYLTGKNLICSIHEVLNLFSSLNDYKNFTEAQIDYGTTLEILKHKTIDIDE